MRQRDIQFETIQLVGANGLRRAGRCRVVRRAKRNGFSLLEVILAVAILGGALVVIGQLHNLGYKHASSARLRSEANIMLDTKMSEIAAGVLDLESGTGSIEGSAGWNYAVAIAQSGQTGLLVVTVNVNNGNRTGTPVSISATRFMPDPEYDPTESFVE